MIPTFQKLYPAPPFRVANRPGNRRKEYNSWCKEHKKTKLGTEHQARSSQADRSEELEQNFDFFITCAETAQKQKCQP